MAFTELVLACTDDQPYEDSRQFLVGFVFPSNHSSRLKNSYAATVKPRVARDCIMAFELPSSLLRYPKLFSFGSF